jgi:hypothetical protein
MSHLVVGAVRRFSAIDPIVRCIKKGFFVAVKEEQVRWWGERYCAKPNEGLQRIESSHLIMIDIPEQFMAVHYDGARFPGATGVTGVSWIGQD